MAGSINKVILVGRLTSDPEVRTFSNGGKVANLRIATSETWKDRTTGERKEKSEFHAVAIHADGLVKVVEQFLRKGSKVYIEGQLETRKWQDQAGNDRYSTEVALRPFRSELHMLDARSTGATADNARRDAGAGVPQKQGRQAAVGYAAGTDFDDDIPF